MCVHTHVLLQVLEKWKEDDCKVELSFKNILYLDINHIIFSVFKNKYVQKNV